MSESGRGEDQDLDALLLARMLEDFLEESREHLEKLTLSLTMLERSHQDRELIDEIFRTVHTLKGTASFVGLDGLKTVAHKMEDVFGTIRKGNLRVTTSLMDTMFEAMEALTRLRNKAVTKDLQEIDISGIVQKLVHIQEGSLPELEQSVSTGETEAPHEMPAPQPAPNIVRGLETIRVSTEKLDHLMNLAGELITDRNRLNDFAERLGNEDLSTIASDINLLVGQLQCEIMGIRLVPIESLFHKFPGVVRNLSREQNKEIELILEGKETELDKTLIEQIHDPLVHLLRNAVDHGIEAPDVRKARGKPPHGRITLSSRHQENNVIIEISDDGEGIDGEKMKSTGVRKGIISEEQAAALSHDEAVRLIFVPGLSTTAQVTEVSGRGVGLDVVKENVQKLRGMVDVRTTRGLGTTFRIRIPLTLAILQVLLVKAGGLSYALPLHTVSETRLISADEIKSMDKDDVILIRDRVYPLKPLSSVLKLDAKPARTKDKIPVVVVGLTEKRVALSVDELVGKQEVVMKSPGDYLGRVKGIEGASILADGSVTLILDVEAALEDIHESEEQRTEGSGRSPKSSEVGK